MDNGLGNEFVVVSDTDNLSMATSKIIKGLIKGRLYRFKYRVLNKNGWSPFSDIAGIRTAVVPSTPMPPLLIAATDLQMQLKFFKPVDNGGSEVLTFELYRNDGSGSEPAIKVNSYVSNAMTHILVAANEGMTAGKIYKFYFKATNEVGQSENSIIVDYALVDVPDAPG